MKGWILPAKRRAWVNICNIVLEQQELCIRWTSCDLGMCTIALLSWPCRTGSSCGSTNEELLRPLCRWDSSRTAPPEPLLEFPGAAVPHHLPSQRDHHLLCYCSSIWKPTLSCLEQTMQLPYAAPLPEAGGEQLRMHPDVVTSFMPTSVFWSCVISLDSQRVGNEETFQIRLSGESGISKDVKPGRGAGGSFPSAGSLGERPVSLDWDFKT